MDDLHRLSSVSVPPRPFPLDDKKLETQMEKSDKDEEGNLGCSDSCQIDKAETPLRKLPEIGEDAVALVHAVEEQEHSCGQNKEDVADMTVAAVEAKEDNENDCFEQNRSSSSPPPEIQIQIQIDETSTSPIFLNPLPPPAEAINVGMVARSMAKKRKRTDSSDTNVGMVTRSMAKKRKTTDSSDTPLTTSRYNLRKRCTNCATRSTPRWRKGPQGPDTLCNACGIKFQNSSVIKRRKPKPKPRPNI